MTSEEYEMPEVGEIVIATVTKIGDHGGYVSLDEYSNVQGFIHISEIAPGWVRNIGKYVKIGDKKVLLVKKISKDRKEIDLSLKQISKDQKKKKMLDLKRHEKGKGIIKTVKEKAKLSAKDAEKLEDKIFSKYDSVYDAAFDVARNGIEALDSLKLSKNTVDAFVDVSSKIKLPSVEIRGILEITDSSSNGVENIKKLLQSTEDNNRKDKVNVLYIGAPKYRISVKSSDFKSAENTLKPILETIQKNTEKNKGVFKFTREESKKTGEG
jgi:translation initiation factor 2 subunit 1